MPASPLTSEPAISADGRQIKLDYNSRESSAHCGQRKHICRFVGPPTLQICITTGGSVASYCGFQISHLNPDQNKLFHICRGGKEKKEKKNAATTVGRLFISFVLACESDAVTFNQLISFFLLLFFSRSILKNIFFFFY